MPLNGPALGLLAKSQIDGADPTDRVALFEALGGAIVAHIEGLGIAVVPGLLAGPGAAIGSITGIDGTALGDLIKASIEAADPKDRVAIFQQLGSAVVVGILSAVVVVPGITAGPATLPGTITGMDGGILGGLMKDVIEAADPNDRVAVFENMGSAIALHVMAMGRVAVPGVTPGGATLPGVIT